jgi:GMP synthase-like glutamine amidotransferase
MKSPTMKPIAVIQHTEVGAPGALDTILRARGHEVRTFRIFRGDAIPEDPRAFAGIVLLGGSMGVHDPLPWIPQELALARAAHRLGIPLAGHCLGSQMLAFALGGQVGRLERPEIGWGAIETGDHAVARDWWGASAGRPVLTFQWHQDTFTPPPGAVRIASSPFCENQACVVDGLHLLVQSHLEMTPALVEATLAKNRGQLLRELEAGNPAVQPADAMLQDLPARTAAVNGVLARLYDRWLRGCRAVAEGGR